MGSLKKDQNNNKKKENDGPNHDNIQKGFKLIEFIEQ